MNKWMAWLLKQIKSMGRVSADDRNTRTTGVPSMNDQSRTVPIREIQPSHATKILKHLKALREEDRY
jgi:hypothetical protein